MITTVLIKLPRRTWLGHQMETFSALLALCVGNPPVTGIFHHKGQWGGALIFSLICTWINGSVNNREAGDFRRYRVHYDVTIWIKSTWTTLHQTWKTCVFLECRAYLIVIRFRPSSIHSVFSLFPFPAISCIEMHMRHLYQFINIACYLVCNLLIFSYLL